MRRQKNLLPMIWQLLKWLVVETILFKQRVVNIEHKAKRVNTCPKILQVRDSEWERLWVANAMVLARRIVDQVWKSPIELSEVPTLLVDFQGDLAAKWLGQVPDLYIELRWEFRVHNACGDERFNFGEQTSVDLL